jgi:hypothetical protein
MADSMWAVTARRPDGGKGRAGEWTYRPDRRIVVRHCGHPTANRPYYILFNGEELVNVLGTFSLLAQAQAAAVRHAIKTDSE